jgi:hypothetical protein
MLAHGLDNEDEGTKERFDGGGAGNSEVCSPVAGTSWKAPAVATAMVDTTMLQCASRRGERRLCTRNERAGKGGNSPPIYSQGKELERCQKLNGQPRHQWQFTRDINEKGNGCG